MLLRRDNERVPRASRRILFPLCSALGHVYCEQKSGSTVKHTVGAPQMVVRIARGCRHVYLQPLALFPPVFLLDVLSGFVSQVRRNCERGTKALRGLGMDNRAING